MPAVSISAALVLSFAVLLCLHVALVSALLRRLRWKVLWLLFPPTAWLAPYWGLRHGKVFRSLSWLACCLSYVLLLVAGYSWPEHEQSVDSAPAANEHPVH